MDRQADLGLLIVQGICIVDGGRCLRDVDIRDRMVLCHLKFCCQ